MSKLTQLYIKETVGFHGIPSNIVFNWDPKFTYRFWQASQEALGTRLRLSFAYHPQTNGQLESTINLSKNC